MEDDDDAGNDGGNGDDNNNTEESVEIFIVRIPFADLVQQTNLLFGAVAVSNVNLVYLKKYNLAHKIGLKLACLA